MPVQSKTEARSIDDLWAGIRCAAQDESEAPKPAAPYLAGPDMRRQDQGRDALQEERPVRQWPVPPAWRALHRAENRRGQTALRCQREMSQTEAQNRRRKADPMRGQKMLRPIRASTPGNAILAGWREAGAAFGVALLFLKSGHKGAPLCHAGAGKPIHPCRGVMPLAQGQGGTA